MHPSNLPQATMKLLLPYVLALVGLSVASSFIVPSSFNGGSVTRRSFAQERSSSTHRQQQGALCMTAARVPFIAGNWKMNPLELSTAKDLAKKVWWVSRFCPFHDAFHGYNSTREHCHACYPGPRDYCGRYQSLSAFSTACDCSHDHVLQLSAFSSDNSDCTLYISKDSFFRKCGIRL